jgi:CHAD domain-containing protein
MKIPETTSQPEAQTIGDPIPAKGMAAGQLTPIPAPRVGTDTSAHALAITELRRLLGAWHRYEPLARLGQDPEELHQLRVTVRRIDATLALFKHQLPESLLRTRKTAKGVLRALGSARDVDVQLAELAGYCAGLPQQERAAAEPLRKQLEAQGARARARMVKLLDSAPTRRWLEDLSVATTAGAAVNAAETHSVFTVMPERVRQRYRKLRKTVRKLPAHASMEEFHEVRRRAKQLRYAIECCGSLFGKPADDLLKALRRMQEKLGVHQDAHMARSRLATLAADSTVTLPAATLFLMGRFAERQTDLISQAGRTLSRSWRRVRGKRWKAMRTHLAELSARAAGPRRVRAPVARAAAAPAAAPADSPAAPQAVLPDDALRETALTSDSKH